MSKEMDFAQLVAQEDEIKILMAECAELEAENKRLRRIVASREPRTYNKVPRQHTSEPQVMTYDELHRVAQYLYQLLDDIDTAGDMAKGDDKLFRGLVERTQVKKVAVVAECDGHSVVLKPLPVNFYT